MTGEPVNLNLENCMNVSKRRTKKVNYYPQHPFLSLLLWLFSDKTTELIAFSSKLIELAKSSNKVFIKSSMPSYFKALVSKYLKPNLEAIYHPSEPSTEISIRSILLRMMYLIVFELTLSDINSAHSFVLRNVSRFVQSKSKSTASGFVRYCFVRFFIES